MGSRSKVIQISISGFDEGSVRDHPFICPLKEEDFSSYDDIILSERDINISVYIVKGWV